MSAPAFAMDTLSAADLAKARDTAPNCYLPFHAAVDAGAADLFVSPSECGAFVLPKTDRPIIAVIGDAIPDDPSLGPAGWDKLSLRRLLKGCRAAAVIVVDDDDAESRDPRPYLEMVKCVGLRRWSVAVVETRAPHDAEWLSLLRAVRPKLALMSLKIRAQEGF